MRQRLRELVDLHCTREEVADIAARRGRDDRSDRNAPVAATTQALALARSCQRTEHVQQRANKAEHVKTGARHQVGGGSDGSFNEPLAAASRLQKDDRRLGLGLGYRVRVSE